MTQRMRGLWSMAAGLALLVGLAWMSRVAVAETAFEWSLRHRVPRLEERVELLEQRQMELDAARLTVAELRRVIGRLEAAEKAAREGRQ